MMSLTGDCREVRQDSTIDTTSHFEDEVSPSGGSPGRVDDRVELLRLVLASRTFQKSPRLTKFLEFICLSLIEGRSRDINEQQIGIQVFGRSATYSAADDSIVRTQARLLRQRLEEYFDHENPEAPNIITVPKGGYVPVFEKRPALKSVAIAEDLPPQVVPSQELSPLPHQHVVAPRVRGFPKSAWIAILILLLVSGVTLGFVLARGDNSSVADALWGKIFLSGETVLIVPSDDALVLFQEFTKTPVALNDYLNGTYLTKTTLPTAGGATLNPEWFAAHQYTSSADLQLTLRIGRLPEAIKANVETRNARVLRIDDLKNRNVILIGGVGANPWIQLFEERLNFDVNWDWKAAEGYVRNKHPAHGEENMYHDTLSDVARKSYGVLAFLPGIEGNGDALLFEGTGMAGTESAADFPFNSAQFRSFAKTIGASRDHMPYFEVLLETTSLGGNAPEARVVAYRIIQP